MTWESINGISASLSGSFGGSDIWNAVAFWGKSLLHAHLYDMKCIMSEPEHITDPKQILIVHNRVKYYRICKHLIRIISSICYYYYYYFYIDGSFCYRHEWYLKTSKIIYIEGKTQATIKGGFHSKQLKNKGSLLAFHEEPLTSMEPQKVLYHGKSFFKWFKCSSH